MRDPDDPADHDEAMRAAALYRELGDGFHEGRVLLRAGTARLLADNLDEGEHLLRKAHELVQPFGPTKTLARCLSALASARLFAGDLAQARVAARAGDRRLSQARRNFGASGSDRPSQGGESTTA